MRGLTVPSPRSSRISTTKIHLYLIKTKYFWKNRSDEFFLYEISLRNLRNLSILGNLGNFGNPYNP